MSWFTRRRFFQALPLGVALSKGETVASTERQTIVTEIFPTQSPGTVRETVAVAHGNMKRLRELVEARPSLSKAGWDWGFGDWETALGAASHMGNFEIAEYLLAHGARPNLFSAAMLGQLDVVKAFVSAQPGVQRTKGPHSITLLAHAKAGGPRALPVRQYLESLGDADISDAVPLSDADRSALPGNYRFGAGPTERIEIAIANGQLTFTRTGTMGRGLFHLGDRVFYPAGASAVRIRFSGDGGESTLTVHDPDLVLTAHRELSGAPSA